LTLAAKLPSYLGVDLKIWVPDHKSGSRITNLGHGLTVTSQRKVRQSGGGLLHTEITSYPWWRVRCPWAQCHKRDTKRTRW